MNVRTSKDIDTLVQLNAKSKQFQLFYTFYDGPFRI